MTRHTMAHATTPVTPVNMRLFRFAALHRPRRPRWAAASAGERVFDTVPQWDTFFVPG